MTQGPGLFGRFLVAHLLWAITLFAWVVCVPLTQASSLPNVAYYLVTLGWTIPPILTLGLLPNVLVIAADRLQSHSSRLRLIAIAVGIWGCIAIVLVVVTHASAALLEFAIFVSSALVFGFAAPMAGRAERMDQPQRD